MNKYDYKVIGLAVEKYISDYGDENADEKECFEDTRYKLLLCPNVLLTL